MFTQKFFGHLEFTLSSLALRVANLELHSLNSIYFVGGRLENSFNSIVFDFPPASTQSKILRLSARKQSLSTTGTSNASDDLDKLRYLSVTEPELLSDGVDLDIHLQADKDNGIITITDSGIGMTRQELIDCLGTIAQSGTPKFLKALEDSKDAGADKLICQLGVGFILSF